MLGILGASIVSINEKPQGLLKMLAMLARSLPFLFIGSAHVIAVGVNACIKCCGLKGCHAMTFKKMLEVLTMLRDQGYKGFVDCTTNGHLRFCFSAQLEHDGHAYMLKKGFVYRDQCYVYLPY